MTRPSEPGSVLRRFKSLSQQAWVKKANLDRIRAEIDALDDPDPDPEQERMARYLNGTQTPDDIARTLAGDPPWQ